MNFIHHTDIILLHVHDWLASLSSLFPASASGTALNSNTVHLIILFIFPFTVFLCPNILVCVYSKEIGPSIHALYMHKLG